MPWHDASDRPVTGNQATTAFPQLEQLTLHIVASFEVQMDMDSLFLSGVPFEDRRYETCRLNFHRVPRRHLFVVTPKKGRLQARIYSLVLARRGTQFPKDCSKYSQTVGWAHRPMVILGEEWTDQHAHSRNMLPSSLVR